MMTLDDALAVARRLVRGLSDTGASRMDAPPVIVYRTGAIIRIDIDTRKLARPEGDA